VSPPAGARAKTALYAEPLVEWPVDHRDGGEVDTRRAEGGRLTDRQRALLTSLPRFCGGDTAALRRLEARGLVRIVPRVVRRAPASATTSGRGCGRGRRGSASARGRRCSRRSTGSG